MSTRRGRQAGAAGWRRALRRELAWALVLKFLALLLLWLLFFSPTHRHSAGREQAGCTLALASTCAREPR